MRCLVVTMVSGGSSGARVLVLIDGSQESHEAALAAADLFASTPCASVTVLAPADLASGSPEPSGGGLVQLARGTAKLMETVRRVEARGLRASMRTTEGSLLAEASRVAPAHTVLVLGKRHAAFADEFPVPVLLV